MREICNVGTKNLTKMGPQRTKTACRLYWFAIGLVTVCSVLTGCKMEEISWIDNMISEMESAYGKADRAGLGQEGEDAAVTAVAHKYIRPGTPKEEAFKLLKELSDHGFKVRESRHDGAVAWPDRTILPWESAPYPDPATIKNLKRKYEKGTSYFSASKMYGRERVIIAKNVGVSFKIDDQTDVISDVGAALWADAI